MRKSILLAALAFGAAFQSQAGALRLPSLISDHMVLQQGVPARIWGWAAPGATVTAQMGTATASAVALPSGRFSMSFAALPAGGPFELTISAGESITVHDVLLGEVWLGAGQSNMEFAMSNTHDAAKEISASANARLRLFQVERHASALPEEDVKGSWKLSAPDSVGGFSAVAYHFGKNLQKKLKAPVGMIASSWGGTSAESWTPRAAFESVTELASLAKTLESDKVQMATWTKGHEFEIEVRNLQVLGNDGKPMALPMAAASGWMHSEKPGARTSLKASGSSAKFSGNVEGGGWASMGYAPAGGAVDISGGWIIEFEARGKGTATVLVHPKGAADWDDFGSDAFELGAEWHRQRVHLSTLKQGGWGMARAKNDLGAIEAFNFAIRVPYWPELPAFIYNGMAAPLTPYAIKGALWYQGESNSGRAAQYKVLLPAMIKAWRAAWGLGEFPFLIVQLPDYADGDFGAMRQAQKELALATKKAGLISTLGLGEAHNIHPRNKTEVGKRLADLALYGVYKKAPKSKAALVYDQKELSH